MSLFSGRHISALFKILNGVRLKATPEHCADHLMSTDRFEYYSNKEALVRLIDINQEDKSHLESNHAVNEVTYIADISGHVVSDIISDIARP